MNEFPLSNPGNGAFFQNSMNNLNLVRSNAFISRFNSQHELYWSTLLGQSILGVRDIIFNSSNQAYALIESVNIAGSAQVNNLPNSDGLTPIYSNGSQYFEYPNDLEQSIALMKFGQSHDLLWSTYLHSVNMDNFYPISGERFAGMAIDNQDRVYVGTTADNLPFPVQAVSNGYSQTLNASAGINSGDYQTDSYILGFDANEQLFWGTFFGGAIASSLYQWEYTSRDNLNDLSFQVPYLYVSGTTQFGRPNITSPPYDKEPYPGAYIDYQYGGSNDCFISRFAVNNLPTSLKEKHNKQIFDFQVYPNPTDESARIRFISKSGKKIDLTISNTIGQVILRKNLHVTSGVNSYVINMKSFSSGVYFVTMNDGVNSSSVKVIKE